VRPLGLHPPDYAQNNGEHLWDVDGDGWLDVIATGWGETRLQWFRNPGTEGFKKGLEWKAHTLADTKLPQGEAGFLIGAEDMNMVCIGSNRAFQLGIRQPGHAT